MIILSTPRSHKPLATSVRVAESVKKQMDAGVFGDMERASRKNFLIYLKTLEEEISEKSFHKEKEWVFNAKSGERIAMPAGYFILQNGVLHQVVNGGCHTDPFKK